MQSSLLNVFQWNATECNSFQRFPAYCGFAVGGTSMSTNVQMHKHECKHNHLHKTSTSRTRHMVGRVLEVQSAGCTIKMIKANLAAKEENNENMRLKRKCMCHLMWNRVAGNLTVMASVANYILQDLLHFANDLLYFANDLLYLARFVTFCQWFVTRHFPDDRLKWCVSPQWPKQVKVD